MKENNIITESKNIYKRTSEYAEKINSIKEIANLKFNDLIKEEGFLFKKYYLKTQKEIFIYKQIQEITSFKKLYLT